MNYKGYPIGIHIEENSVKTLTGIVQNDDGILFEMQLYDGQDAYDFSGYSIINAVLERPDGTTITDLKPAEFTTNEAQATTSDDDTSSNTSTETETTGDESSGTAEEESSTSEETTSSGTTTTTTETTTDDNTLVQHTDVMISYVDPVNGRITLEVGGAATAQVGMHRMAIEIYSGGSENALPDVNTAKRLTTARINYNVVATLNRVDVSFLQEQDGYSDLQELIMVCSEIIDAEQERINQEQVRDTQESARQAGYTEMLAEYGSMINELTDMLESAQAAAETARRWAEVAEGYIYTEWPNPPATVEYVDREITKLSNRFDHLAFRTFDDEDEREAADVAYRDNDTYLVLKTLLHNELNDWAEHALLGEMVYCSDDRTIYLCHGNGVYTVPVDPNDYTPVVVGNTEPTSRQSVWIDTSDGNKLKFYSSNTWTAIGSVAFFS